MRIGYACLTKGIRDTDFKSCTMKNAREDRLMDLIDYNLHSLENIIEYNIKENIKLFRISSDIIPFGSSPVNTLKWWDIFDERLKAIGNKIKASHMRVSMHPGQYTVLNSPKEDVVSRAVEDLIYHTRFLDSLGVDEKNKIILHIGGLYGDKEGARGRFIHNYKVLDDSIKNRMVIENDDKSYTVEDVLYISNELNIPVVFDNLHNAINRSQEEKSELEWIHLCGKTWTHRDGVQKIHYSQQNPEKNRGSHSETIELNEFEKFFQSLKRDLDIMLEVKDKNLSAVKCINLTREDKHIKHLEDEWALYKYNILERSPSNYKAIRNLLKDKNQYPVLDFYKLIDEGMNSQITIGNAVNGLMHVWGYFKDRAGEKEKTWFFKNLQAYEEGGGSLKKLKNYLYKLAKDYDEKYLLNSYYFDLD